MNYQSPIGKRYKAEKLNKLFSPEYRVILIRKLWIQLAKIQKELGVESINDEGIKEMEGNIENIDFEKINEYEKRFKHDIIAHIHTFGELCPNASKFIHLGATSNFINDNVDLIIIKEAFEIIFNKINKLSDLLWNLSCYYKDLPTLAYTHLQKAQLITVGKRFCMWNNDLLNETYFWMNHIQFLLINFRGMKGTVGSEDTLLKLMNGDHSKCDLLNKKLAKEFGFNDHAKICSQTYSRKIDVENMHKLSSVAQILYKMMNDIRLLASKNEIQEHFSEEQVGSSAMPYKMNPINCERICSLARYIINQENCMSQTYINQWLERTLDDSAIKRIIYPECFLLTENILDDSIKLISNLVINEEVIKNNVEEQMPFIISEELILNGVKMGYDRQILHEKIRQILISYSNELKKNKNNKKDLEDIFKEDEVLYKILKESNISIQPNNYIGRCVEQIEEFSSFFHHDVVDPKLYM